MINNYEKPRLIFSNVRLNENIADECWSLDGNKKTYEGFYDVEGTGYVSFLVKSGTGSCSNPDAYRIKYFEYNGAPAQDGSGYENELERALSSRGGNKGQPYKGLSFDFPVKPDPSWS